METGVTDVQLTSFLGKKMDPEEVHLPRGLFLLDPAPLRSPERL